MNFDEKYNIKIVKRADYYRGTYVIDGETYRVDFNTKEEVLKNIELDIRYITGERRGGGSLGRKRGTKNYVGRPYDEKYIKRLFGNIRAAAIGACIATRETTLNGISKELLRRAVLEAQFDEYSGNLTASYHATIVRNRKIVENIPFTEVVKTYQFGQIRRSKHGGRYFKKRRPKYHKPAASNTNGKIKERDIRYLKHWENSRGGYSPRFTPKYTKGGANFAPGYLNRGSGTLRTGVLITNDAPYSSAVERTSGRKVLSGSSAISPVRGKWGPKARSLARFASITILRNTFKKGFRR